jgi:subtilase family serine protease
MIESDLAVFDKKFSIAPCTIANKCLEIHKMSTSTNANENWSFETALDTQWAHAIAPEAKILVVESKSSKASDLLKAVDYAKNRSGVVSVSMSWGGDEFPTETKLDSHFATTTANKTISFFASSGDDGTGANWPAVSPKVIAVGGTSLVMKKNATSSSWSFAEEKAWNGSGGGLSLYEKQPTYQKAYSIPQSDGRRSIPDVSYAADPARGFSVYHSKNTNETSSRMSIFSTSVVPQNTEANKGWYVIGGTSAGAPQWAAIAALGAAAKHTISHTSLYSDKSATTYSKYFRDIVSGKNGTCTYYCAARKHYDFVTGLGSPLTHLF